MSAYKIAQTILYACSGIPLDHCLNREVKAGMMLKEAAWRLPNGQGTRINLTQIRIGNLLQR